MWHVKEECPYNIGIPLQQICKRREPYKLHTENKVVSYSYCGLLCHCSITD
jgi:hypothetical protein